MSSIKRGICKMTTTEAGTNLLYKNFGLKNLDLDKLSTKQVELLEIQNKLCFYRKRSKNVFIKLIYATAACLMKIITFFEINNAS